MNQKSQNCVEKNFKDNFSRLEMGYDIVKSNFSLIDIFNVSSAEKGLRLRQKLTKTTGMADDVNTYGRA